MNSCLPRTAIMSASESAYIEMEPSMIQGASTREEILESELHEIRGQLQLALAQRAVDRLLHAWQPIETAPITVRQRDPWNPWLHRPVLVSDGQSISCAFRHRDCWFLTGTGAPLYFEPTHWAVLPELPGRVGSAR